ncbi:hypothetical protein RCG17_07575 [Neobacillus sp. PS3-12]|uniref:hypothetical protein n=1 Tax=Neobacillus sp. PS3-12 TaxID=3070677 RepID=UPI0027E0A4DF|nr:hypothetical protein [Neobacillus sp. PS3-12]WML54462.1 hypothetical protein RCG17_07575 [Neobacillus sp. PS3-12]
MQLSDQIIVLTSTIFNLNDINTYILKKDGSVLLKFERNLLPPFLLEFQQQDFFTLWEEAEQHTGHCCILTNEFGLTYLASLFTESGEEMKLIVNGPFLRQIPDSKDIKNKNKFNEQTLFIVIQFLRSLKLLSSSKISSMANALVTVHPLHQVPLHSIDTKKKIWKN